MYEKSARQAQQSWQRIWINGIISKSKLVICSSLTLACASLLFFYQFGSLNSDLASLIKPSPSLTWFQDNERYKREFPAFQQTAIVVIRGDNFATTQRYTKALSRDLSESEIITEVFAPGVNTFISQRLAYFLKPTQLDKWIEGAKYNHGALLRLTDEPSLANFLFTYTDFVSANSGQPLPISLESIVDSLGSERFDFKAYYPLAPDGEMFSQLIIVNGLQRLEAALPNSAIIAELEQVIAYRPKPTGVEVALTGEVALAHEEISAALNGIELAGFISLFLLAIILHVGIRSWQIVLSIGLILALGISLTLGFATLTIGSFNTLSMIFVVLFFGLAVDFAAHLTLRIQAKSADMDLPEALIQSLEETSPALILCTLTSAVSFLAFLPTDYQGFAELGIISAGGIVIAFIMTITVIPALLIYFPPQPRRFGNSVITKGNPVQLSERSVIVIFTVLTFVCLWVAKDLRFDYSVLAMRDSDSPAMRALLDLQKDNKTTDYSIHVLVPDDESADAMTRKLLALDSVSSVTAAKDFVPENQRYTKSSLSQLTYLINDTQVPEMPAEHDPEALFLALGYLKETIQELKGDTRKAAQLVFEQAQILSTDASKVKLFDQRFTTELHEQIGQLAELLQAQPFDLDDIPREFKNRLISSDGMQLLSVQPAQALAERTATDRFIEEVRSVAPNSAGRSVVEWGIGSVVVTSFQQAVGLSFTIIFIILLCYFRDWKLSILVFIPIILTIISSFAVCVLLEINLNMANILMVPLIIGLGLDSGIHIVHRHRVAPASQLDAATGKAVIISGLTTIATFCSLALSPHQGAASIGLLLSVAIGLLLVISLVLLPILLRRFSPRDDQIG